MSSVKFDGTEIIGSTYIPRFVKHESNPDREINAADLTGEDGSVFISTRWGKKIIRLQGIITGATQAELEDNIDDFKELFAREEKNLDIGWNGTTRRYVATCIKHEFDRDYFNLLFVPWTAEFMVLSGEGKGITETTALDSGSFAVSSPATQIFTIAGSKPPKPKIKITLDSGYPSPASGMGIELKNDAGDKLIVTRKSPTSYWSSGDYIRFDFSLKKVYSTLGGRSSEEELDFYGSFFKLLIGTNNIIVTIGGIVNQKNYIDGALTDNGFIINSSNIRCAQSFRVNKTDKTFQGIELYIKKVGSPESVVYIDLVKDNNGKPTGSTVATFSIPAGSITTDYSYQKAYSASPFELEDGKNYWILVGSSTNSSNYFVWATAGTDTYARGYRSWSDDAGSTWNDEKSDDHIFRILFGGKPNIGSAKCLITYYKTYL